MSTKMPMRHTLAPVRALGACSGMMHVRRVKNGRAPTQQIGGEELRALRALMPGGFVARSACDDAGPCIGSAGRLETKGGANRDNYSQCCSDDPFRHGRSLSDIANFWHGKSWRVLKVAKLAAARNEKIVVNQ